MRYYLITVQYTNSGAEARSITGYDDINSAELNYHKTLSSNMADADNIKGVLCAILNSTGGIEYRRYWERPVVEENSTEE